MDGMTAAAAGRPEGTGMVKQGDRVWTRCTYDGPDRDGYPVFSGREGSRMLPDHPALPALAAWLVEPGNLEALVASLEEVEWRYVPSDIERPVKALLAALERP